MSDGRKNKESISDETRQRRRRAERPKLKWLDCRQKI
jgi:hypothetical protein